MQKRVVVVPWDSQWLLRFQEFESKLKEVLGELAIEINHVGSTSVPGLAAKPVIDIDVGIDRSNELNFEKVKAKLASIGYECRGNLGIPGRETFRFQDPEKLAKEFKHHLYVSDVNADEYIRHKVFRDYLENHPEDAKRYGDLKIKIVTDDPDIDIEIYIERKFDLIGEILKEALKSINRMDLNNRDANFRTDNALFELLTKLGLMNRKQEILNLEFTKFNLNGELIELDLGSMGIQNLPIGAFDLFNNLEMLNLSGNRLTELPNNIFHKVPKLWAVGLQNNKLEKLAENLFEMQSQLKIANFSKNRLKIIPPWISKLKEAGVKVNISDNTNSK